MKPTPNTTLYLLKNVDLDPEYNYTIDFDDIDKQVEYFNDKKAQVLEYETDYSYIRDNETLKVQVAVEDLLGVNYLMYKNSDKWFFAFITRKDYVNPNTTRISFKLDVYQSFMFDYELQESFIDREHQDRYIDGKPIYNTQEENLHYGKKYKLEKSTPIRNNSILRTNADGSETIWQDGYMIVISAEKLEGDTMAENILEGNFLTTPYYIYGFPMVKKIRILNGEIISKSNIPSINNNIILKAGSKSVTMKEFGGVLTCDEVKTSKKILSIYFSPYMEQVSSIEDDSGIPVFNVGNIQEVKLSNGTYPCVRLFGDSIGNFKSSVDVDIDLYTGVYNISYNQLRDKRLEPKLYTNPYLYLQLDNYQTDPFTFYNEYLKSSILTISCESVENLQPKWRFSVDGYLNDDNRESLIDTSIVDLPLLSDAYLDYVSQNKASMIAGLAISGVQTIGGIALGAISGGIGWAVAGGQALSFAGQVANHLVKTEDLKKTPETTRNIGNNGMFTLASLKQGVNLNIYSILDEYKDIIYNYFYHYGYKSNSFKKPNIKSRYYFNYIKMVGTNIKTNIDAEYKNELANIYNNGITIWHYRNKDTFKGVNNYEYENAEMSLI